MYSPQDALFYRAWHHAQRFLVQRTLNKASAQNAADVYLDFRPALDHRRIRLPQGWRFPYELYIYNIRVRGVMIILYVPDEAVESDSEDAYRQVEVEWDDLSEQNLARITDITRQFQDDPSTFIHFVDLSQPRILEKIQELAAENRFVIQISPAIDLKIDPSELPLVWKLKILDGITITSETIKVGSIFQEELEHLKEIDEELTLPEGDSFPSLTPSQQSTVLQNVVRGTAYQVDTDIIQQTARGVLEDQYIEQITDLYNRLDEDLLETVETRRVSRHIKTKWNFGNTAYIPASDTQGSTIIFNFRQILVKSDIDQINYLMVTNCLYHLQQFLGEMGYPFELHDIHLQFVEVDPQSVSDEQTVAWMGRLESIPTMFFGSSLQYSSAHDVSIILHEAGHAIKDLFFERLTNLDAGTDRLGDRLNTPRASFVREGIEEGFCDYIAATVISKQKSLLALLNEQPTPNGGNQLLDLIETIGAIIEGDTNQDLKKLPRTLDGSPVSVTLPNGVAFDDLRIQDQDDLKYEIARKWANVLWRLRQILGSENADRIIIDMFLDPNPVENIDIDASWLFIYFKGLWTHLNLLESLTTEAELQVMKQLWQTIEAEHLLSNADFYGETSIF